MVRQEKHVSGNQSLGDMILDINRMLTKEEPADEEMHFLRHLQ